MKSNIPEAKMPIVRQRQAGGCSLLIGGFISAIIGGCVLLFLGSDLTLTCQRSSNTCILEKTSMLGRREVTASLPLSRVKSAEVESQKGSIKTNGRRRQPTYQIILHTDDGSIPFSNVWTWQQKAHKQTASDINTYLASSKESLTVVQSGKSVRLIGWIFLAVGGLAFLRGLRGVLTMFRTLGSTLAARG